jgi:hypothetical protein
MRKRLRIVGGFLLLCTGAILALPGVPGPGIAFILLGLLILSDHFVWASKLLQWVKSFRILRSRAEKPEQLHQTNAPRTAD